MFYSMGAAALGTCWWSNNKERRKNGGARSGPCPAKNLCNKLHKRREKRVKGKGKSMLTMVATATVAVD